MHGHALPPVDRWRGTSPSQAAKFRPLAKVRRSGANAIIAPAVTGPTPDIVQSLRIASSTLVAERSLKCSSSIVCVSTAFWSR
jgi:hypothetical protein